MLTQVREDQCVTSTNKQGIDSSIKMVGLEPDKNDMKAIRPFSIAYGAAYGLDCAICLLISYWQRGDER